MKPTPIIDPGEPAIHRQPHTPGPDPVWALDYSPPSANMQDGSDGGSSAGSDGGVTYTDGSGPV
jgi:hypothetical protein